MCIQDTEGIRLYIPIGEIMNEEERNVLEQQLQENGIGDIYYCRCGSYTLTCENGQSYSCHSRNIEKIFPRINHGLFKKI